MADRISIRDLTTQLENKDGHNVTAFFSGKFEEERFKDLDAIRQLNQQDRAAGKTNVTRIRAMLVFEPSNVLRSIRASCA